jgi:hypothetical protein
VDSESFCFAFGAKRPYFENNTSNQHDDFNTVDYKKCQNSRFRKTISGSFTGLFTPVVPLHINKPLTINVDELNRF